MSLNTIESKSSPLVVIDVETSGINAFRHQILAVGLVPLLDETLPLEVYIRPESITWSSYAKKIFQKYEKKWEADAVTPSEACDRIERYLSKVFPGERAIPVGHNIGFDISFLKQLAFFGGRDELAGLSHRVLDTHTMLYLLYRQGKLPASALSSDGAFQHFKILVPESQRHTALGDAIGTKKLVSKLLDLFEVEDISSGITSNTYKTFG
ncbi:MAG: 3'-5' exonuclease [Acidiferrobacterales bacterium]